MTDAEKKRLKELATEASRFQGNTYGGVVAKDLSGGVLALLERIEALEVEGERRRLALIQEQRFGNLLDQMFPTVITRDATTDTLIRGYGDAIEALEKAVAAAKSEGEKETREKLAAHFSDLEADAAWHERMPREELSSTAAWAWTRLTFQRCASDAKTWRPPGDAP